MEQLFVRQCSGRASVAGLAPAFIIEVRCHRGPDLDPQERRRLRHALLDDEDVDRDGPCPAREVLDARHGPVEPLGQVARLTMDQPGRIVFHLLDAHEEMGDGPALVRCHPVGEGCEHADRYRFGVLLELEAPRLAELQHALRLGAPPLVARRARPS